MIGYILAGTLVYSIWMTYTYIILSKQQELKSGICQCGHFRCNHLEGKYGCVASGGGPWPRLCACQTFINKHTPSSTTATDSELKQLKKMAGL